MAASGRGNLPRCGPTGIRPEKGNRKPGGEKLQKIYRSLTKDQKVKDIVFSSALSITKSDRDSDTIHHVLNTDEDKDDKIRRLKDDSFFNNSPYKYNIIRQ